MKDWPACVEQCDKVLRNRFNNVKALYRKGVALGRPRTSTTPFVPQESCPAGCDERRVKRALRDVVQAKKTQQKQLKSTYGGMFSKLEGFASSNRPKEPRKVDDYDLSDEDYDLAKPGASPLAPSTTRRV